MLSRNAAHSAESRIPCRGTSCSLPNQRSAARTLLLWFASVFAVTPTRAWCNCPTGIRTEVQRAGIDRSRAIKPFGDLAQRADPVATGLLRQFGRLLDGGDEVDEGRLKKGGCGGHGDQGLIGRRWMGIA